ncbi:MAG: 8-oxoguanine deaminase [Elusimicrobiota bacterium]
MRPPLLIKNALRIATMDDAGTELKDADVLIRGRVIVAVGKGLEEDGARVLDARGCVVIPGMVNTHHHLCQTLTRATPAAQDAKLFDWLVYHYTVWRHLTPEYAALGAQVGLGELLLTGCTTSTDHTYLYPRGLTGLVDAQIEAAKALGIRFHPTRGSMSVGSSHGGLPPDDCTQAEEEILRDGERLVKEYHDNGPYAMTRVGLAPCAPFSVSPELMKETAAQAKKWGVRVHTHLCETLDEEAYCLEKYKLRPVDFIESLGWMDSNVWLAHMVHVGDDEIKRLAKAKVGIAHCPSSNFRLGSGVPPVRKYMDAGVPVGLAVDGSASNDTSDMLGEARQAMLVHRVKSGVSSMPARDALRLATRGGAAVVGTGRHRLARRRQGRRRRRLRRQPARLRGLGRGPGRRAAVLRRVAPREVDDRQRPRRRRGRPPGQRRRGRPHAPRQRRLPRPPAQSRRDRLGVGLSAVDGRAHQ